MSLEIRQILSRGVLTLAWLLSVARVAGEADVAEGAAIGKRIFMDTRLSDPVGQSCVSCHDPQYAFSDPRPVSPGAVSGQFGTRNAPSLMYAALTPALAFEDTVLPNGEESYAWEGGVFWDGRSRDLFEQVKSPFFHSREMNVPSGEVLAERLRASRYAEELRKWVGESAWEDDERLLYFAYRALVAFLQEPVFRPFDSRIDDYLSGEWEALNAAEKRGLLVFREKGKCADCHLLEPTHWSKPLLSDFGYDNLGVPSRGEKDAGLGRIVDEREENGKFRAPSLRNVALTAPYMHNGSLATLREVVEFYNERDVTPERWGSTDYPDTVNHDDFGDLRLTEKEVDDLLALMEAFTDRNLLRMRELGESFPSVSRPESTAERGRLHFPDWTHRFAQRP